MGETRGRWVIESDPVQLLSDTVHHRLLMKAVRRRISDARFADSAVENHQGGTYRCRSLSRPAVKVLPQGGVISPLIIEHHARMSSINYLAWSAT